MIERILSLVAVAVFLGFVGILIFEVPRIDLGVVILITSILVFWDVLTRNR